MEEPVHEREGATEENYRRERLLDRVERITEAPLLILAALMIPLLVGSFLWDLTERQETTFLALDIFIWSVFAADLMVKTAISPRRSSYLKAHWIDVVIVVVPFVRPLRLVRLFVYGSRAFMGIQRMMRIDYLLVYGVFLVMVSATVVTTVETGENAQITSFPDALWWTVVTVTTVGYGDVVPVSEAGRAMAYILVLGGVALFGALTANFSALLIKEQPSTDQNTTQLVAEIRALRRELAEQRGETVS